MENSNTNKVQLGEVNQIGIVVKNIDKVIESWSSMFGLGPWNFRDKADTDAEGRPFKVRIAHSYIGTLNIELIQPVEGRIFQSRFLDEHGEGIHHLGFYVDDVDEEAANLVAQGAKVLFTDPGQFAYMDSGGPGGVIFELIKKGS